MSKGNYSPNSDTCAGTAESEGLLGRQEEIAKTFRKHGQVRYLMTYWRYSYHAENLKRECEYFC